MTTPAVYTPQTRLPMPAGLDLDARKWRVLVEATFPSARTSEAIVMALDYCAARGLDIFKRPINIVPMWNSTLGKEVETVWPGINEVQITAARTREWAGMETPCWGPDITRTFMGRVKGRNGWEDAEVTLTYPEYCSVTVYRMIESQRCPFTEPVFWAEAYSRMGKGEFPTPMWIKRPRGQLHKVAKAASLRAAFPEGGEYTAEEMEGKEIEAGGVPVPEQPPAKRTMKEISAAAAGRWRALGEIEQDILQIESAAALERYQREVLTPEAMTALGEKQWAVEQYVEERRRELTGHVELEPAGEPVHVKARGRAGRDSIEAAEAGLPPPNPKTAAARPEPPEFWTKGKRSIAINDKPEYIRFCHEQIAAAPDEAKLMAWWKSEFPARKRFRLSIVETQDLQRRCEERVAEFADEAPPIDVAPDEE